MMVRRATKAEREHIISLVIRCVTDVGYASYSPRLAKELAKNPRALVDGPWERAHVAVLTPDDLPIGVVLTERDIIDDLWIDRPWRRRGAGRALLEVAKKEIAARGFSEARLRVAVQNENAVAFYRALGWRTVEEIKHERYGFPMLWLSHPV